MNFQDCIDFAQDNSSCFLATIDGDQPHVRTVLLVFADDSGFYFETMPMKEMSKQLHKNQKVEVCFLNDSSELARVKQMRIKGEVEFIQDQEIIDRVYDKIRFLEDLAGGPFKKFIEVYRISHGDAHFWTMQDIGKESEIEHLVF